MGLQLEVPWGIPGRLQGMFAAAVVPQALPKYCCAVCATPDCTTPVNLFVVRIFDPSVFGKFCCAQATNSGVSNVWMLLPVEVVDHRDSTSAKKKVLFLTIGPPNVAARSF